MGRLSLCTALAYSALYLRPIPQGYWIPPTVALVMKPDLGSVFARAMLRSIGTVGAVVAVVISAAARVADASTSASASRTPPAYGPGADELANLRPMLSHSGVTAHEHPRLSGELHAVCDATATTSCGSALTGSSRNRRTHDR